MVEKNPHSEESAVTQKLSAGAAAGGGAAGAAAGEGVGANVPSAGASAASKTDGKSAAAMGNSGSVSTPAPVNSGDVAADSVAARRAAHGLSPEATGPTKPVEPADARRKEKDATAEERKRKAQRKHKAKVIRNTVIVIVLLLIIGALVGFWLLRWGLHDDVASIQGKWRVQGTDTVITISDEEIELTDEVAYDYVLNPEAKTLTFKFGALTGDGRYRFSLDHNMLAIDDGEFDAAGTLMADIPWTLDAVAQKLVGNQEKSPALESSDMVLERVM